MNVEALLLHPPSVTSGKPCNALYFNNNADLAKVTNAIVKITYMEIIGRTKF